MSFHEVRFPPNLSFGSVGGPERRTEVVTLANGFEERNTPWAHSRRRYDAGMGMRSLDDIAEAIREMGIIGLAAGSLFVFKGKLRAVLISYPQPDAKEQLIRDAMAARGQA